MFLEKKHRLVGALCFFMLQLYVCLGSILNCSHVTRLCTTFRHKTHSVISRKTPWVGLKYPGDVPTSHQKHHLASAETSMLICETCTNLDVSLVCRNIKGASCSFGRINKLFSGENKVPRTLFEARKLAKSTTYKRGKAEWLIRPFKVSLCIHFIRSWKQRVWF